MGRLSKWGREEIEHSKRASRGELLPGLTFTGGEIRLLNRFDERLPARVPYDNSLEALSQMGRDIYTWWLMYGSMEVRKRQRKKFNLLPDMQLAHWIGKDGKWKIVGSGGIELQLEGEDNRSSIWRGEKHLCYAGFTDILLHDKLAIAIANEIALGREVEPFHFEGEPFELNATSLRISRELYESERRDIAECERQRSAVSEDIDEILRQTLGD